MTFPLPLQARHEGLVRSPEGRVVGNGYELVSIDDGIEGDVAVQSHVDHYLAELDSALAPAGLGYRQTLVEAAFDVWDAAFAETPIGDLVTDAYRAVVSRLQPTAGAPIAIEYNGLIRADLRAGNTGKQWFADLFRVLPLGIGPDARPGYPLVTFHLAGPDIKGLFELTAASKDVLASNDFFSQVSGVRVEYAPERPPFDRVTGVTTQAGAVIDLADASTCHRFTANLYVASLVGLVEAATGGAVAVRAKAADCRTAVTDWSAMIVDADPTTAGTQELKAWQALMGYVSALPDATGNGIADLPSVYGEAAGRIVRVRREVSERTH